MRAKVGVQRAISALRLAAPFAAGARWSDYGHCVEMSTAGAIALKRFGVEAKPTLCATLLMNDSEDLSGSMGLTRLQVYELIDWSGQPQEPFEEWCRTRTADFDFQDDDPPMHCVIHVPSGGGFFLVDLTFGQIRGTAIPCAGVPASVAIEGPRWPVATVGAWRVKYMACAHDVAVLKELHANMRRYAHNSSGLVDDLVALMGIAVVADNDYELFTAALRREMPNEYEVAVDNLHTAFGMDR